MLNVREEAKAAATLQKAANSKAQNRALTPHLRVGCAIFEADLFNARRARYNHGSSFNGLRV